MPIVDRKTQVAFSWPDTPKDSQPLFHASRASPPALLLAPVKYSVVDPIRSTVSMAQKFRASGVRVQEEQFDNVGRITLVASMASVLRGRAPVLERVTTFIKSSR